MSTPSTVTWPTPGETWGHAVGTWPVVEAALAGSGAPVCTHPDGPPECTLDPDTAVLIGTSGSTGRPKLAQLTAASLRASVDGVHAVLGGPGQWLLSVSPAHISGFHTILRSRTAGHDVVVLPEGPFTPGGFSAAVRRLTGPRRYTMLVPTQLVRLLEDPAATQSAASLDGIIVGGAPLSPAARARAEAAGIRVVIGYGSSETSGGCVYDGLPVPAAQVRLDDGRVMLGGDVVARRYAGRPDLDPLVFCEVDGVRWFRTDDVGELVDGRLRLLGRADDVVNTGGLKVSPRVVADALAAAFPEVVDVLVVGVPHPEWGEAVAAALVLRPGAPTPDRAEMRARLDLPGHAVPHIVLAVPVIPTTGPGKPDRAATRALLSTVTPAGD